MSSTISQRLVEGFQTNAEAVTPVLEYLKEFTSVFSKQTFDILPEPKVRLAGRPQQDLHFEFDIWLCLFVIGPFKVNMPKLSQGNL